MPWMEGTVDRGRTNAICIATEGRREHVREKCSTTTTCSRARFSCLKFTPPGANKYGAGVVSEQPLTHEISTDIYSQFSSCVPKIICASLLSIAREPSTRTSARALHKLRFILNRNNLNAACLETSPVS